MKSFHVSRKSSNSHKDISDQELFYHTRRLFKSNKKMVKKLNYRDNNDSRTQASYNVTPKRMTGSSFNKTTLQHDNNENNLLDNNKKTSHIMANNDNFQQLEQSFDKYFTSSACKFDAMRETEYLKSKRRFLPKKFEPLKREYENEKVTSLSLNESLLMQQDDQPWKKIYPRIKKCDFTNRTQRGPLFYIPSHIQRDDQRRYANFSLYKLNPHQTMSIQSKKWRDYKVFDCPLVDKVYDDSYKCYTDIIYNSTSMKCKFETQKEVIQPRVFYSKKRTNNIASSILDDQKVLLQKDNFSVYKKNGIVQVDKITGREQKGIMPQNLLKDNENVYAYMPKTAPGKLRSYSMKK